MSVSLYVYTIRLHIHTVKAIQVCQAESLINHSGYAGPERVDTVTGTGTAPNFSLLFFFTWGNLKERRNMDSFV